VRELLLRHQGPILLVTIELEGPTRISAVAAPGEADRLVEWVARDPDRAALVEAATVAEDLDRARAWTRELRGEGFGIAAALIAALVSGASERRLG
jgi:hypothetical protein